MFVASYRFTEHGARQRAAERGLSFPAPKTPRIAPSAPTASPEPIMGNVVVTFPTRNRQHRRIIDLVSRMHGVTYADVMGPRKFERIVLARQAAMCAIKEFERDREFSLPQMGRLFGGKDHTTVLWAFSKRGYAPNAERQGDTPAHTKWPRKKQFRPWRMRCK